LSSLSLALHCHLIPIAALTQSIENDSKHTVHDVSLELKTAAQSRLDPQNDLRGPSYPSGSCDPSVPSLFSTE